MRSSKLLLLPLIFSSCGTTPFLDPWAYAPKNSYRVWKPEQGEARKISYIEPNGELNVPNPSEPVSLGDLFDIALRNSPATAKSWQEAREAAASYSSSLASYFPSLDFVADVTTERQGFVSNALTTLNVFTSCAPQVSLSYLLWDSGQTKTNAEYYFQTLQQLNWEHNEELQIVMQKVALTYYEHLYAKELLIAIQQDFKNAEYSYEAASEKVVLGIFDETDKMQARTNYLRKKVEVTEQEANVKNSFVNLLSVLGIPCTISFQLGSFPSTSLIDPFDMPEEQLIDIAKKTRPDYQGAKATVLAKESQLKNAKARTLPQLSLVAEGGQTWYSTGFTDGGDYSVTLNLSFPLFSGFFYANQVKKAESALKTSVANLRSSELRITQEIKISNNNYVMAKNQLTDTKNYLDAAEAEFEAMLHRYKTGVTSILDLLSAETFLSNARALYVKAQKTYFMSIIDMAFATGVLTSSTPWNKET